MKIINLKSYRNYEGRFEDYLIYRSIGPHQLNKGWMESLEISYSEYKKEIEEIDLYNKQAIENNKQIKNYVESIFKEIGIDTTETSSYRSSKRSTSKWYQKMLLQIPTYDNGYKPTLYQSIKETEWFKKNIYIQTALANKNNEEKERKEKNKLESAILFLKDKGKELGVDYNISNAIDTADQVRYDELVKEKGHVDEFDGMNCEDCTGWDGESRRCDCGNRRVSWESSGDFENMYIYASAW